MNSDVWVILHDVQLNKKVGQTSFTVKLNGKKHMISIPVSGGNRVKINHAVIPYSDNWIRTIQMTLHHAYSKSPYYAAAVEAADYLRLHQRLNTPFSVFCEQFTLDMLRRLGWQGSAVGSMGLAVELKASERMAEIASLVNGTHYLCGKEGFTNYLNVSDFRKRNLIIKVQEWNCPEYAQSFGTFLPNLSILDLLANVEMKKARKILLSGGTTGWSEYE
jgi:hypothetical protein